MSKTATSFVDECLAGHAFLSDVDDWIDAWHDSLGAPSGKSQPLNEYLGMTKDEYRLWVEQPNVLRFVVAAHRQHVPVQRLLTGQDDYALAARSADPEDAKEVVRWLVSTGRIDPRDSV